MAFGYMVCETTFMISLHKKYFITSRGIVLINRRQVVEEIGNKFYLKGVFEKPEPIPSKSDIKWYRLNYPYSEGKNQVELTAFNFSYKNQENLAESTLSIPPLRKADHRTRLTVVLQQTARNHSISIELNVTYPPMIFVPEERIINVNEFRPLQLTCDVDANPEPYFEWKIVLGSVVRREKTIQISSVRSKDRGVYFCTAENYIGKDVSEQIRVNVKPKAFTGEVLKVDLALAGAMCGFLFFILTCAYLFANKKWCFGPSRAFRSV